MSHERILDDIVTTFFLNTCRLHTRLNENIVQAVLWCASIVAENPADDTEADFIPLITGSAAEFYIEPMLPLVGDIDVMFHPSDQLAIPRGHPPPTQLPAEFSNYVKVCEIIDSHLPGYVYLELCYLLSKCTENGNFSNFEYYNRPLSLNVQRHTGDGSAKLNIHGPALLRDNSSSTLLSVDQVPCIRCLSWPPQATDWPTRHRNYVWPDSATVERVVNNGCDVVGVAHPLCGQHELMCNISTDCHFHEQQLYC